MAPRVPRFATLIALAGCTPGPGIVDTPGGTTQPLPGEPPLASPPAPEAPPPRVPLEQRTLEVDGAVVRSSDGVVSDRASSCTTFPFRGEAITACAGDVVFDIDKVVCYGGDCVPEGAVVVEAEHVLRHHVWWQRDEHGVEMLCGYHDDSTLFQAIDGRQAQLIDGPTGRCEAFLVQPLPSGVVRLAHPLEVRDMQDLELWDLWSGSNEGYRYFDLEFDVTPVRVAGPATRVGNRGLDSLCSRRLEVDRRGVDGVAFADGTRWFFETAACEEAAASPEASRYGFDPCEE